MGTYRKDALKQNQISRHIFYATAQQTFWNFSNKKIELIFSTHLTRMQIPNNTRESNLEQQETFPSSRTQTKVEIFRSVPSPVLLYRLG